MLRQFQIIFAFSFAVFAACSSDSDFYKEPGNPQKIEKILPHFNAIKIGEKFYAELKNDTNLPESIQIDYFENLNPKISVSTENGILTVKDLNGYNWMRDLNIRPKLTINLHKINALNIVGSCEMVCIDTLKTDMLTLNMESSLPAKIKVDCGNLYGGSNNIGSIYFEGRGTIFSWGCEMGSSVNAANLRCDDAYIRHYTKQDIYVSPDKVLEAHLYNSGNLLIKNKSFNKFNVFQYGSGKVFTY